MQKYNHFLNSLTTSFPVYILTSEDEKTLASGNIALWITGKLLRNKFRKKGVSAEAYADIFTKVTKSINENRPLYLIITFGGYKHFWNSSHPYIDWAELFNLRYMSEFVSPILTAYKPGVILDYASDDIVIPLLNNYPKKTLDAYAESFNTLIAYFSKSIPHNFKIILTRSKDQYDTQLLFKKMKEIFAEKIRQRNKLNIFARNDPGFDRSSRNIMWHGEKDLTKLSEKERMQKIIDSRIFEEVYYEADLMYRRQYLTGDNHIAICLSWGLTTVHTGSLLVLGSTRASVVDFWIGKGVLEDRGDKIVPRIISQIQYTENKKNFHLKKTKGYPFENFKTIEVSSINFSIGVNKKARVTKFISKKMEKIKHLFDHMYNN